MALKIPGNAVLATILTIALQIHVPSVTHLRAP